MFWISVPTAFKRSHSNCFYLYSAYVAHYCTRFICFWLWSISDWSQFVLERSHSDRFELNLSQIHISQWWLSHTHQCEHGAYKHSLLASSFTDILRFKFSIKNLTRNIQKLSTGRFLQYLNEASDVLNLIISSDFLHEALDNQSLALLAMETTIRQVASGYTEFVFSRLYNIF